MIVFVRGEFVPEEKAVVSVFDRSFLYGDGLFEVMRVRHGRPFQWEAHFERLQQGAEILKMRLPYEGHQLRGHALKLIEANELPEALLRVTLSRGVGVRGYSPKGADSPTLVLSMHPAPPLDAMNPPRWRLITSSIRVAANDHLATIKTCNKLAQVLARAEAEARGADEAVPLNTNGEIAETAGGNLFWIERDMVCTTPITTGVLAGVTRATVLDLASRLGISRREKSARLSEILEAEGVFVSLSTLGIVEAIELDATSLGRSPLTARLRTAWLELLEST